MRLKSFYAQNMTEAMHLVREALGENAIIIATREEGEGKSVRVTAAVEEDDIAFDVFDGHEDADDFEIESDGKADEEDSGNFAYGMDYRDSASEALTDILLRHGVQADVIDHILSCAEVLDNETPRAALTAALEHLFAYKPLLQSGAQRKPLLFVGPPGAGKTLTIAKIAARAVMSDQTVTMLTADTIRAGGVEQLAAFAQILKTPLHRIDAPKDLKPLLANIKDSDLILIDSWGVNPFDPQDVKRLAGLVSDAVEPVLVMPSGIDAAESGEIARVFSMLGVRSIVPTRLDIARRFGGLLEAAHHGGMRFADASTTPDVVNGLQAVTPQLLCDMFMPRNSEKHEKETLRKPDSERRAG